MANREYFIVDGDGYISTAHAPKNGSHEPDPEAFATLKDAKRRACTLAESEPGRTVVITRAVAYVTCPIVKLKVEVRKLYVNKWRTAK